MVKKDGETIKMKDEKIKQFVRAGYASAFNPATVSLTSSSMTSFTVSRVSGDIS
ncbi:hypothetical protein ES705_43280 [subsurface metagenome]